MDSGLLRVCFEQIQVELNFTVLTGLVSTEPENLTIASSIEEMRPVKPLVGIKAIFEIKGLLCFEELFADKRLVNIISHFPK